eukprot:7377886-Prymnesium_polylepis.1
MIDTTPKSHTEIFMHTRPGTPFTCQPLAAASASARAAPRPHRIALGRHSCRPPASQRCAHS